jgi:hypothetical protein
MCRSQELRLFFVPEISDFENEMVEKDKMVKRDDVSKTIIDEGQKTI